MTPHAAGVRRRGVARAGTCLLIQTKWLLHASCNKLLRYAADTLTYPHTHLQRAFRCHAATFRKQEECYGSLRSVRQRGRFPHQSTGRVVAAYTLPAHGLASFVAFDDLNAGQAGTNMRAQMPRRADLWECGLLTRAREHATPLRQGRENTTIVYSGERRAKCCVKRCSFALRVFSCVGSRICSLHSGTSPSCVCVLRPRAPPRARPQDFQPPSRRPLLRQFTVAGRLDAAKCCKAGHKGLICFGKHRLPAPQARAEMRNLSEPRISASACIVPIHPAVLLVQERSLSVEIPRAGRQSLAGSRERPPFLRAQHALAVAGLRGQQLPDRLL